MIGETPRSALVLSVRPSANMQRPEIYIITRKIVLLFNNLFSKILKRESEESSPDMGYYKKAEQYIRHNYGYNISVTDIARHVGVDRTYLYKLFKKYSGTSPKQFLTAHQVSAAQDLLTYTALSVTEIALSCGFRDSSSFCRIFNHEIGMSPLKYRKTKRPLTD